MEALQPETLSQISSNSGSVLDPQEQRALDFALEKFQISTGLLLNPAEREFSSARVYLPQSNPFQIDFPSELNLDAVIPRQGEWKSDNDESNSVVVLSKGIHKHAARILQAYGVSYRHLDRDSDEESICDDFKDAISAIFRTRIHDLIGSMDGVLPPGLLIGVRGGIGVAKEVTDKFTQNHSVVERTPAPNRFAVAAYVHRLIEIVFRLSPFISMNDNLDDIAENFARELLENPEAISPKLTKAKQGYSIQDFDQPLQVESNAVGIIGLGGIGKLLSERIISTGGRVFAHDIDHYQKSPGVNHVDAISKLIDNNAIRVISLHVSDEKPVWKTSHTEMLRAKHKELQELGIDKKWVFINTSRGPVVEREEDIRELVDEGILEVAILDVFREERYWFADELHQHFLADRAHYKITPHALGSSIESDLGNSHDAAYGVLNFLLYGVVDHAMNAPEISVIKSLFQGTRSQEVLLHVLHDNDPDVISIAKSRLGSMLKENGFAGNIGGSVLDEPSSDQEGFSLWTAKVNLRTMNGDTLNTIDPETLQKMVDIVAESPGIVRPWLTAFERLS